MASVTLDADKINKGKSIWRDNSKVYARRTKKGSDIDPNRLAMFPNVTKPVVPLLNNRVKINLKHVKLNKESKGLSKKLKLELDQVRGLVQKLEDKKRMVKAFRSCNALLQRLMKHKNGWIFNEPVDAAKFGVNDYHEVIKQPMDLGTIKSRLAQNFYKLPREFAEDVRLTFCNALKYNREGHEVHTMAKQLLNIFEEKWKVIESECNPDWMYSMVFDADRSHRS
ncbi:transcription factor GTE3, chloroplastic-like [Rutidosis leptorrhynchoides]|uniref:transcription factor GTE3, chloroplastic-like n=1 Tax=Rutidosis leptorrhynchoides TaxID=125765 RepID=UPI003A99E1AC